MSNLFSPLLIQKMSLSNRIVMPPMALDIATEQGEVTDKMMDHYAVRARQYGDDSVYAGKHEPRGIGLLIAEHSYINIQGQVHPRQLGIFDDRLITGLSKLADKVHAEGIPVGIQLSHSGARGLKYMFAPSAVPVPFLKRFGIFDTDVSRKEEIPQELSKSAIKGLIDNFAQAALRAKSSGFDFVEIHGAHGYLLNQFYSPLTNRRNDEYGGSLLNRLRFSLEVAEAVRAVVGPEFPIFYRLGADDRMIGGTSIEDSCKAAVMLEKQGIDCLDLSGGICGYLRRGEEGFFLYMADAIKPICRIPILITGGIKSAAFANRVVMQGRADLLGIGRAILSDPCWAAKAWKELYVNSDNRISEL